eukprot:TRINITY_DN3855_c0_g1_i6.p1 TRINITY_DN3855_c0_g1~~TRINITY_DN3855_c0_g1_i6.p1  ORF type:complete len:267 (-),score=58.74 TRINITY_DN3855_c0_g1_i6:225-977(-)
MSDEECDYMSDDFLAKLTQESENRPGLKRSYASTREHEKWKKKESILEEQRLNKKIKKSIKEIEEDKRDQGLQTSIDSSNKGFAMLAKMGYKPGTSLGKDNSGRTEPVPITVKAGRGGLGRDEAMKKLKERKQRILEERARKLVADFNPNAFRAQMREKHMMKRLESDLWKAQKSCRQLDLGKEYSEPMEFWFWPREKEKKLEDDFEELIEEEEEIIYSVEEQLVMVVEYLRTEHLYCIFCAIKLYLSLP